jgi:adenine-specific DNA methylase
MDAAAGEGASGMQRTFVDFFAGSGAVSRLAKLLGYYVVANDWEEYAWILNEAFVVTNKKDLESLFSDKGGIARVLAALNALDGGEGFISRYYAPRTTEDADPERERMFYTSENARRIDAIRAWIEHEYPGEILDERRTLEKRLLLGLLLYEAATHANTSGVFKGYHCGFGGRGGDALARILKPVEMEYPALCDGSAEAWQEDAERLARRFADAGREIDIAYLDPPYNQHQYGSNYHLLNTIARGDEPPVHERPLGEGTSGRDKAGIRRDWVKTKSDFCSKARAAAAFERLTKTIRARHILVSYSTEGMIPLDEMAAILGDRGRLDLALMEYTRYRGGKQALTTNNANIEFVLIAHTAEENTEENTKRVLRALHTARLEVFLKRAVSPAVLIEGGYRVHAAECLDDGLEFEKALEDSLSMRLYIKKFKTIESCVFRKNNEPVELEGLTPPEFDAVLKEIARLTAITREEELGVTLSRVRYLLEKGALQELGEPLREIPLLLKKFNESRDYAASLQRLDETLSVAAEIAAEIDPAGGGHFAAQGPRVCHPGLIKKYTRFVRRLDSLVCRKMSVLPRKIERKNDPALRTFCARLAARSNRLASFLPLDT